MVQDSNPWPWPYKRFVFRFHNRSSNVAYNLQFKQVVLQVLTCESYIILLASKYQTISFHSEQARYKWRKKIIFKKIWFGLAIVCDIFLLQSFMLYIKMISVHLNTSLNIVRQWPISHIGIVILRKHLNVCKYTLPIYGNIDTSFENGWFMVCFLI